MKHLGDISQISGFDIEPPDVVIGGSPCFVAGTPVFTSNGFKDIETINEFEHTEVLSHDGRFHKVVKTMSKFATVGEIKIEGVPTIECTAEHPFFARVFGSSQTEWISANQLTRMHLVCCPKSELCNTDDFCLTDDGFYWVSVVSTWQRTRNTTVYNLEIEETHSYNVYGIIVHNCQDLSIAGARKGIKHSELDDDETTRSGLFMEQIRLVKELRENDRRNGRSGQFVRPRYMVWENVEGAFSSNNGADFRTVLEECAKIVCEEENEECPILPVPDKNKWSKCGCIYDDLGRWSIAWTLHNAADWCVPQRRKRISLVCDFGGLSSPQILFESNGLSRNFEPSREKGQGTTTSIESCFDKPNRNPNDATDNGNPYTLQVRCGNSRGGVVKEH